MNLNSTLLPCPGAKGYTSTATQRNRLQLFLLSLAFLLFAQKWVLQKNVRQLKMEK